jgi:CubicO group peptidase (beta-lactamase class C family)
MFRLYIFAAICLANSDAAMSETKNKIDVQIDNIFSEISSNNSPGCSVGVFRDRSLIFKNGYGLANLEHDIPLSHLSVHRVASISKQFTAFAVLLLADDGKIALENDIRTYMPDLPDYGHKVSINSMLGHFSGMGDFDSLDELNEHPLKSVAEGPIRLGNEDYLSIKEFYDVVIKLPLKRKPNQSWEYSNFAYFLLSKLIEKQSGLTLRQFADKKIFKPLGMKQTFFNDNPNEVISNRVTGYRTINIGGYEINMTNLFWVGDGGLHTNIADLALWDNNFYNPELGRNPEKLIRQMNTPNSTHAIDGWKYANGQFVKQLADYKTFEHTGDWLGTSTFYARVPENKISVAVFCNNVDLDAAKFGIRVLNTAHKYFK